MSFEIRNQPLPPQPAGEPSIGGRHRKIEEPIHEPVAAQVIEASVQDDSRMAGYLRKTVGALLVFGVAAGIATSNNSEVAAHSSSYGSEADPWATKKTAPSPAALLAPTIDPVTPTITGELAQARQADNCRTKTNPERAATIYQRLFGTHESPDMTAESLIGLSNQAIDRLQAARAGQTVALPASFDQLKSNTYGSQIPIAVYKQAARDYLSRFGIKAQFDWQYAELIDGMSDVTATPVSDAEADSTALRQAIVDTMSTLSTIPQSLVRQKSLATGRQALTDMYFAHATADTAGATMPDESGLLINVDSGPYASSTTAHESSHLINYAICGLMGWTRGEEDTEHADGAWQALGRGFQYGQSLGGQYTELAGGYSAGSQVVVAESWGATSSKEDIAMNFGEHVLYLPGAAQLFAETPADMTPLREKVAWELARLEARDPAAAEVLMRGLEVARLSTVVQQAQSGGNTSDLSAAQARLQAVLAQN